MGCGKANCGQAGDSWSFKMGRVGTLPQFSYERQQKTYRDTDYLEECAREENKGLQNGFLHGKVRESRKEFK